MDKTRQIGENENEQGKQIYRSVMRCSRLKKEKKIASQCLLYYRTCASTMKAYTTLVLSLFCCCMYLTEEQKQQWLSMGRSPAYRRIDTLAPNNLSDNPNSLIQLKIRPCLFFSSLLDARPPHLLMEKCIQSACQSEYKEDQYYQKSDQIHFVSFECVFLVQTSHSCVNCQTPTLFKIQPLNKPTKDLQQSIHNPLMKW